MFKIDTVHLISYRIEMFVIGRVAVGVLIKYREKMFVLVSSERDSSRKKSGTGCTANVPGTRFITLSSVILGFSASTRANPSLTRPSTVIVNTGWR